MELKELLSNMSSEELLRAKQEVNKEIERRREGDRAHLEDELRRLVREIRRSGFQVRIDVGDCFCFDNEFEDIEVV